MKTRMTFSIERNLRNRFYDHVKAKYQGMKGGLSLEIEAAISSLLDERAHTKTHKIPVPPGFSKIEDKVDTIIRALRDMGIAKEFSARNFEVACSRVAGSDPRTVKKYLDWAQKLKRVRHRTGQIWELQDSLDAVSDQCEKRLATTA